MEAVSTRPTALSLAGEYDQHPDFNHHAPDMYLLIKPVNFQKGTAFGVHTSEFQQHCSSLLGSLIWRQRTPATVKGVPAYFLSMTAREVVIVLRAGRSGLMPDLQNQEGLVSADDGQQSSGGHRNGRWYLHLELYHTAHKYEIPELEELVRSSLLYATSFAKKSIRGLIQNDL